ncbi:hypothetical protein AAC387_Pa11g1974 [Persea americana]
MEDISSSSTLEVEQPRKKRRTSKKSKSTGSDVVKDALEEIAKAVHALAESIKTPFYNLIPQIIEVVASHHFIPANMKLHVIDFLSRDDRRALMFLSFNDEMKIQWLEMNFHLGSSTHRP